jgi:hypothetical protein
MPKALEWEINIQACNGSRALGFLPMSTPPLSNLVFEQIVFCIIRGAGHQGKWTQRVQLTSIDHVITSHLMVDRELKQAVEYKYLSLCLSVSYFH